MHGLIQNPDVLLFVMKGFVFQLSKIGSIPVGLHTSQKGSIIFISSFYMFLFFISVISHQK